LDDFFVDMKVDQISDIEWYSRALRRCTRSWQQWLRHCALGIIILGGGGLGAGNGVSSWATRCFLYQLLELCELFLLLLQIFLGDFLSADGTDTVLWEPGFNALNVEVVSLARQNDYLFILVLEVSEINQTDSTWQVIISTIVVLILVAATILSLIDTCVHLLVLWIVSVSVSKVLLHLH